MMQTLLKWIPLYDTQKCNKAVCVTVFFEFATVKSLLVCSKRQIGTLKVCRFGESGGALLTQRSAEPMLRLMHGFARTQVN